jgi:hypothetical protein
VETARVELASKTISALVSPSAVSVIFFALQTTQRQAV